MHASLHSLDNKYNKKTEITIREMHSFIEDSNQLV